MCQMSPSVIDAYQLLMGMHDRATKSGKSSYHLDRIEQAMDYLLNKPLKVGDPQKMVRDLMGGAGTKLRGRIQSTQRIAEFAENSVPGILPAETINQEFDYLRIEFEDIVSRLDLSEKFRRVLLHLSEEGNAKTLSDRTRVSLKTARKDISNARRAYKESEI
ncbi:hypothetical protein B9G55_18180 [Saccharibacillus sp. O16]|nr:hypothetical protein B9G55_18180 [Saccharibacillus sp. O16]